MRPALASGNVVRLIAALAAFIAWLVAQPADATGLLIPGDPSLGPLAIRSHRVNVEIHERVAETRVVQVFRNHTDRVLEATYIFPIPPGASVSGFAMMVNGQRQEGQVLEANEARGIYEGIVARLRDPGLVEYIGGNLFRARVFPIPARGDQQVEIRFTQTLDYQSSTLHYRYPLRTSGPQAATMEDFTLSATIASRTPIRAIYSPTHRIDTTRRGERGAVVGFEEGRAALDRDFDLFYTVADSDVGLSVLTHHPRGEDGYFLMMLAPRTETTEREIIGKDLLFVVDTSGSMAGEKMEHARQALRAWIERLNPDDTFNILRFSTDVEQLSESSLAASPDNRQRALRFVNSMEASGGTAIAPALQQALAIPVRRGAPRVVVFLTDGMPTVGETSVTRIVQDVSARNGGAAQVFVFGLGDDVNTTFLDLLAQQNRGAADYARSGAEMSTLLGSFYNKIAFPVLADLRLALRGADAYDIYPRDLGTLYRGGQLVVTGRYRTPGDTRVALTAIVAGQQEARTFEWPVALPASDDANGFIPRVWGTRKVGYLLDEIRLRGENPELRESVIALARRFGIVTPYTSYLITDEPAQPRPVTLESAQLQGNRRVPGVATSGASTRADDGRFAAPAEEPAASPDRDAFRAFQSLNGAAPARPAATTPPAPPPPPRNGPMGGSFAPPAVQAAPQPAPVDATGEAGRRIATTLRSMREAERVTANAGGARFVAGRSFVLTNGVWQEDGLSVGTSRVLRVRAMSRGYFALLRLRPQLREALALGAVRLRLDAGRVIEVTDAAPDAPESEVEGFLR